MSDSASAVVVDTDVMSYLFNQDPVRGARYEQMLDQHVLVIPFIVIGEMRFGAKARGWGAARCDRLEAYLKLHKWAFPDDSVCRIWASVRADAKLKGRTIERQDAWIAAVALSLGLPLITHNASHYEAIPLLKVHTA